MTEGKMTNTRVTWVDGLQFVSTAEGSRGAFVLDSPSSEGGPAAGTSPVEALLSALGGCAGMDVISILKKKRQRVTGLYVAMRGRRAEEHPRRYTHIEMEFVVRGFGVSPQAVARAIELSETKYCSVAASLNAEIVTSYRVEEEPAGA